MPEEKSPGRPTTRRYTDNEKAQAVRLVRQLRKELGSDYGTIQRVASQLGYGLESVRSWVRQADIDDGLSAGTTTAEAARIKALEQEVKELRRTNAILRSGGCRTNLDHPARVSRRARGCWHGVQLRAVRPGPVDVDAAIGGRLAS